MKFVLKKKKKKNVLKTKTNLHFVHQKTSKGKIMKRKEMNGGAVAPMCLMMRFQAKA